ncbi:MAG: hypothetical protein V1767_05840, partial [Chloroflexota bacterium]
MCHNRFSSFKGRSIICDPCKRSIYENGRQKKQEEKEIITKVNTMAEEEKEVLPGEEPTTEVDAPLPEEKE